MVAWAVVARRQMCELCSSFPLFSGKLELVESCEQDLLDEKEEGGCGLDGANCGLMQKIGDIVQSFLPVDNQYKQD